ncbi:MAG: low specificity L-threonine aldolase [Ruminococcaceae bacterium]|nr:low specificity L-threonine aldolase [Oscillospiraceae bacterium]
MITFESDYTTGAHPEVLQALIKSNLAPQPGYGSDEYCERAKEKIRRAVGIEAAQVEFLVGGTQTNAVVISAMLADYEGVIAAVTGHINAHESGAVEYTGHKVLPLPHHQGKIDAAELRAYLIDFYKNDSREHMVFPGMVYISYPTEYGTLYSKKELEAISAICGEYKIPLFVDGARLGYGLMSRECDLTLPELARFCDVFYIGGTKVGALCGEAVVFTKGNRPAHFLTSVKKRGALLAKGRLLGVQFDALFTNDLYFRIGAYAIQMAERLKDLFAARAIPFFLPSPTNQQFVILENDRLERIRKTIGCSIWEPYDEAHTVVRFATSWSTTEDDLAALAEALET